MINRLILGARLPSHVAECTLMRFRRAAVTVPWFDKGRASEDDSPFTNFKWLGRLTSEDRQTILTETFLPL